MNREQLLQKWAVPTPVLDHGHVQLVDVMGDDERVEQVARLSYQKGTRKVSETRALLRYLIRNKHTSPLEQAIITLDMKMPIFVARQLVRHRMQSLNELSGRYSELPTEYYVPDVAQICEQSTTNKQGRGAPLDATTVEDARWALREEPVDAFNAYRDMLTSGVARETARMVLPLSTYTQWCTTMNLHNLLHMLELRLDPHAQWECRQYAEVIAKIVKDWCPIIWEAFEDYRLEAEMFSKQEMLVLRTLLNNKHMRNTVLLAAKGPDWPTREKREFLAKLGVE